MAVPDTAATFVGISNENEFYTHHYLAEVFQGDIKDTLERWKALDDDADPEHRSPYAALRALAREYHQSRNRAQRERAHAERIAEQCAIARRLVELLGFQWRPRNLVLEDGDEIPVLATAGGESGAPALIWLEAYDAEREEEDPLGLKPHKAQFHGEAPPARGLQSETWNEVITRRLFTQEHPPRWVLLISDRQCLLIDRSKWNQNRLLRFDFDEILGRREDATLKATATLLYRESLVPGEGASLLDSLDENSHKHAFAVSKDLKYALRESIALLGNEAVWYLREVRKDKVYKLDDDLAGRLTLQCLRYMYRLLFLFYIESRPDLGYAPVNSEAYLKGYSLEHLRDLELVRLNSQQDLDGNYLHHSIDTLFRLVREGFDGSHRDGTTDLFAENVEPHNSFQIRGVDSHLFDPGATPLLNKVRFRNKVLQQVIRLMSLTRETQGGRRRRRGRISYAQLGINQLGAVYEALLSYRGFFAEHDLYEVKKAGEHPDELETAYFVPSSEVSQYTEDERVYDRDEQGRRRHRVYPKGTFIYRLAGRDRKKSASYYTPEFLTRTLVKYALKERVPDAMPADEILRLTICEPAMGSAAFLNEAVNQLAERYLERKQRELDRRISHTEYPEELQKVKMYIADRNVYGVDLNPVAVELAEVSLWLNTIHGGGHVPWFGYQLICGNSLVGARREVFESRLLSRSHRGADLWLDARPRRIPPGGTRPEATVYHFLLPDKGMANYTDKVVKHLVTDGIKRINDWRKHFCKEFDANDVQTLLEYSRLVDDLWVSHTRQLARDHRETEDTLPVWGWPEPDNPRHTANAWKDRIRSQGIFSHGTRNSSAYRRLKLVMDYWCALWFWPIDKEDLLPTRGEFLFEVGILLRGNVVEAGIGETQIDLQFGPDYAKLEDQLPLEVTDKYGVLDLTKVLTSFPRLRLADDLARRYHFHHWELAFADLFEQRGGFDLILGNPPWIKIEWQEAGVLGDANPLFDLRGYSAHQLIDERARAFGQYPGLRDTFFEEYEEAEGTQNFLNARQNYPALKGMQTNLYKCFLPQAWMVVNEQGVSGFLHPEGIYDDPKGGPFRVEVYQRLRAHFQFHNELNLFAEVDHHAKFSINVYGKVYERSEFSHLANLYTPATVDPRFLSWK